MCVTPEMCVAALLTRVHESARFLSSPPPTSEAKWWGGVRGGGQLKVTTALRRAGAAALVAGGSIGRCSWCSPAGDQRWQRRAHARRQRRVLTFRLAFARYRQCITQPHRDVAAGARSAVHHDQAARVSVAWREPARRDRGEH